MTRKRPASGVSRDHAHIYLDKARGFRRDAAAMVERGSFSGNGIAVLVIHGAIAYADALTIRAAGKKSKGEQTDAPAFLESVLALRTPEDRVARKAFQALVNRKDEVSYADDLVDQLDARAMIDRLAQFAAWAERRYATLADVRESNRTEWGPALASATRIPSSSASQLPEAAVDHRAHAVRHAANHAPWTRRSIQSASDGLRWASACRILLRVSGSSFIP